MKQVKILELFGGVGSPRCALRNIGVNTKAIDYVEIDEKAVKSYNSMFADELEYKTQSVIGWNLKPDILIHGSPCQDVSIAGLKKGNDENSGTRSSLMWETVNIIKQMGEWKPKYVIWENVVGVLHKKMSRNFVKYLNEMENLGYTNSYKILDARDFGLPQARKRVFTVSTLGSVPFEFDDLITYKMKNINDFLENDFNDKYLVTQPSMLKKIDIENSTSFGVKVIKDYCYTITCKQMRAPNSGVIDLGNGQYRYLTELECWRLQGYSDDDYYKALEANPNKYENKMNTALYKQAGNSIPVTIFESIFRKIILGETKAIDRQMTIFDYGAEVIYAN
ncbi:DNA cytosine methyltransferase [Thomasclavelia cocleata]|uniref:DNA cytosine methyltransferase n=1 Tax=Thomasclavelia cocleata TaxID=69824 RepID=UPI00242D7E7C|nr:DNA (cytosine-5-)-methyltransferase [Thomasclavelia cocleata]